MMLQLLPPEVLTQIAGYLPIRDAEEFSRTCQNCYFAILPYIWHHLSLHDTTELNTVAKRLRSNDLWAQRAIQFVRDVSLTHNDDHEGKFAPTVAASMFGIAASPAERAMEDSETTTDFNGRQERIGGFGKRLLQLFPHLSSLVLDFHEAARYFYNTLATSTTTTTTTNTEASHTTDDSGEDENSIPPDDVRLPYSGSVSLINYKSDHTKCMHYLLAPFRRSRHLKLQTSAVISLCDDIDESILTNEDIADLATMGLTHVRTLELSYLDTNISLETLKTLIQSLPRIRELHLEWVFPPTKQEFATLCQELKNCGSLHADKVNTTQYNRMQARFTRLITNN